MRAPDICLRFDPPSAPSSYTGGQFRPPPEPDPKYGAAVYFFQASTFRTELWIDPGDTAGLVQRTVQAETYFGTSNQLVAVSPQPVATELVFLDTAPWNLQSLLIPVLIDLMTDRPCRYLEVFRGKVDFDVIRLAVGHKWAPGCRIYVGPSETPLRFGEIAQLQPGALIRIIPRGKATPRCVATNESSLHPACGYVL